MHPGTAYAPFPDVPRYLLIDTALWLTELAARAESHGLTIAAAHWRARARHYAALALTQDAPSGEGLPPPCRIPAAHVEPCSVPATVNPVL